MVGVDPTWAQISSPAERGGGPAYAQADAAAAAVRRDGGFDAVVACLVFEHIASVDDAIAEVARVLEPGGRFLFFLNHPLLQTPNSGWIDDQMLDPPEQYWRIGPYLVEDESVEEVEKDVFIPFIHRPLSAATSTPWRRTGLLIERMDEPPPPPGFLARAAEYAAAATIPGCSCWCPHAADPAGTLADGRHRDDHGPVGGGRTNAAGRPRGPRVVRRRQPAPRSPSRCGSPGAWPGRDRHRRLALVVGTGAASGRHPRRGRRPPEAGHRVRIVFLEATTPELVERYGSTRRRHPLDDGTRARRHRARSGTCSNRSRRWPTSSSTPPA